MVLDVRPTDEAPFRTEVKVNTQGFDTDLRNFFPPKAGNPKPNPARLCKAELAQLGKTAFEHKYGKNHNLRNAMGKCVSLKARGH